MRYRLFTFDRECVLDLKNDEIIFPFSKKYLEYQDWVTNNPNEYSSLVHKGRDDASWQGLLEEIKEENGVLIKQLFNPDYTLWVESEVRLLPNQNYQTHGLQKTYNKDSGNIESIETFINGYKHGPFTAYNDKEHPMPIITIEGEYKSDKKVGEWFYYWPLSKQIQVFEKYYDNGKLEIKKEFTKQNKMIRSFNYDKDGNLNGHYKDSHGNGELRARGNMKNGRMDGVWYFYYIDGTQEYTIKFNNGKLDGKISYYGMDGKIKWEKETQ